MLLSLTRRLRVTLAPEHITVCVSERGWRRPAGEVLTIECAAAVGEPAWHSAVAALRGWLAEEGNTGGSLHVEFADRYAKYALVPWSDQVRGAGESAAMARAHVEMLYGDVAAGWEILADINTYGAPGIACAIDTSLLDALRALCREHKLRMKQLRPTFMRAVNEARASIGTEAMLAIIESGQCVLATRHAGAWHSIRTVRTGAESIEAHIERELLLQGLDSALPRVILPGAPTVAS